MPDEYTMRAIAHIRSDFDSKFGIPRQSGVVPELEADIVFTPEFRNPDALRGIERCSHIWLIWLGRIFHALALSSQPHRPVLRTSRRP